MNAGVHAHARGGRVIQSKKKSEIGGYEWRHAPEARGGFWEIWKVSGVENKTPNGKGRLSGLAEGRRICALRAPHEMRGGVDEKVIIERLCISFTYVEEPLNSKVIKSFVPELRSRNCFSCFGIPMFYVYMLWTFCVRFTYPYHGYGTNGRWWLRDHENMMNVEMFHIPNHWASGVSSWDVAKQL